MRNIPFDVSVRELAITRRILVVSTKGLQEFPDVALFFPDVRNLAYSTFEGETSMKRFLITIALTCALSPSALAGDIPSVGAPSPAGTTQTTSATEPGDSHSPGSAEQISSAALSALLTVLGLL